MTESFRKSLDHCQIPIRSLETLGVTSDTYGKLLCPLLLKLLPTDLVLECNKLNNELVVQNLMDFSAKELHSREKSERQLSGVGEAPVWAEIMTRERATRPRSKAAVPITQGVPVLFDTVRLPDEKGSPIHGGRIINGQGKISPEASPSVNLTVPVPAFPLTIRDDPDSEERYLSDSSPDKRTIKIRFGQAASPSWNRRSKILTLNLVGVC
ncbi:uncharacterized protein TNCV_204951 [Trichonephila clavipes]|nr:uncharacterized protein TNCV_204951 [Trichonephila clavipes]